MTPTSEPYQCWHCWAVVVSLVLVLGVTNDFFFFNLLCPGHCGDYVIRLWVLFKQSFRAAILLRMHAGPALVLWLRCQCQLLSEFLQCCSGLLCLLVKGCCDSPGLKPFGEFILASVSFGKQTVCLEYPIQVNDTLSLVLFSPNSSHCSLVWRVRGTACHRWVGRPNFVLIFHWC